MSALLSFEQLDFTEDSFFIDWKVDDILKWYKESAPVTVPATNNENLPPVEDMDVGETAKSGPVEDHTNECITVDFNHSTIMEALNVTLGIMKVGKTLDEILKNLPEPNASTDEFGYKGVDIRNLIKKHLNSALFNGRLHPLLLKARTTLTPEVQRPVSSSDYRPIYVLPHITRIFHRIINERINIIEIDPEQLGFRKIDGC
ncbi:unnamed protein product [Lepeophtheirus salmonis]|uniref:(salmon louse) hypothetical protein n=1 Tax=Lepeophtheirus salmonis TaxID=72036 RepID=A0A7R8H1F8_LEPSM|nr:unnamed protein product [Lepeophtheirus salmonis]CAF2793108.1 unnamed protein product [Lepeophtheirus salmonis]